MSCLFKNIKTIKNFLPPKENWNKVMKDENIDPQKKFLLNGLRFMYTHNIIIDIRNKLNPRKIKITTTGSKNLSSDIDIQMSINLSKKIDIIFLKEMVKEVERQIKIADGIWGEFPNRLDVNFYPSSLINFVTRKREYNGLLFGKDSSCCWIPCFHDKKLIIEFIKEDLSRLNDTYKPNLKLFYKKYKEEISETLYTLCQNYKQNHLVPEEHNKLILNLTKYDHIGPEMYFCYSSVIFVVWHMQLGNSIPEKIKKILAIPSYLENKNMYMKNKKEKYKIRMENSKKIMDKKFFEEIKNY